MTARIITLAARSRGGEGGRLGRPAAVHPIVKCDEDVAWKADAACRDHADPDIWFPMRGESSRPAKAICATCTVRETCLDFALRHKEKFGVWGGTSERERRNLRRNLTTGKPVTP